MTESEPLEGGYKVFAIVAASLAGLVALTSLPEIGGAVYSLATGKAFGSELASRMVESNRAAADGAMQEVLARSSELQIQLAPYQLATVVPYVAALLAAAVLLLMWLVRKKGAQRWVVAAALAACVFRLPYGYVRYQLAQGAIEGMQAGISAGMKMGKHRDDRAQDVARQMGTVMSAFGRAMVLATAVGETATMVVFWTLCAWVFRRAPTKPPPRPSETPAVPG